MINYDLHSHSTFSDGTLTPADLIERAARRGVAVLALTDHDDTGGLAAARLAAAEHGIHPEVDGALSERFYVSLWDTPIEGEFDWNLDPDGCEPLGQFGNPSKMMRPATNCRKMCSRSIPKSPNWPNPSSKKNFSPNSAVPTMATLG